MSVLHAASGRRQLPPVRARGRWIAWGLALQVIGVGIPVATALHRAHESGVAGGITHYTVRLIWHEMLRSGGDVALIALGVVLFGLGAIVMARPFVRSLPGLLVAVPLAAVCGLLVLGVLALVLAAIVAAAEAGPGDVDWADLFSSVWPGDWPSGRRRK